MKEYLCPILGHYQLGKPRSVVLIDNALTHTSDKIEDVVWETEATLIYGSSFSPQLNPIKFYFACYKSYLKKHNRRMVSDWYDVHVEALNCVDRDQGNIVFKKSKVPGAHLISTCSEFNCLHD